MLQIYAKFTSDKRWRNLLYLGTVVLGIYRGQKFQYEWFYLSAMMLGYWVCDYMNNLHRGNSNAKINVNAPIRYIIGLVEFAISIFLLTASYTKAGQYVHGIIMNGTISYTVFFMFGWTGLVLSLSKLKLLRELLETRVFQYIGKHSFAYYAVHWPVVISGTCALTLMLFHFTYLSYAKAAAVSIIATIPVVLLIAAWVDKYIYPYALKGAKYIYGKLTNT